MKKSKYPWKAVLLALASVQPVQAVEMNRELGLIFQALANSESPEVQANLLRGTLAGLSGKRDLSPPKSWHALRGKLVRSKSPEVVKLAGQLSQIFGDLSVSEDALKLVLNEKAEAEERKEALVGLVAMRFEELPKNLKSLLGTPLRIDAIRAYSSFDYSETAKDLLSEYEKFDTIAKRATIDTLASKKSYSRALLEAMRKGKIVKSDIPNYTARSLNESLGESFREAYGELIEMGELSKIGIKPVKPMPDGFADARRIDVGVLPGLKFDTSRIKAKAGEKVYFVFPNADSSGMMHNLAIITPGSSQTVMDAAVAMGATGLKKNFIPEIPELLASTPQVAQGMQYTLYFAVPEEPGDYHFICTYPGHGLIMQGVFAVE